VSRRFDEVPVRDPDACSIDHAGHPAGRDAFDRVRRRSLALTADLEVEDMGVQPSPEASPPRWHLAHTTWFFETFLLRPFLPGYRSPDDRYEYLFNSYYNAVGEQYPRARRGDLSRPTVAQVLDYRAAVDAAMARLLADPGPHAEQVLQRTVLGLHHEEQHQELLVTDLKMALGHNPLQPVYAAASLPDPGQATESGWSRFEGGLVEIGAEPPASVVDRDAFVFDNESPRHRVWLDPFELADRCVTCGEYLAFMEDGGYRRHELWLSDGWAWLQGPDAPAAPLYWQREGDRWFEYALGGRRPLDPHAPVTHVSFYEADAFACWAGARLPREAEWEHAASLTPDGIEGGFQEDGLLHPGPDPGPVRPGPRMLLGNQWEWTASAYLPYPRYRPLCGVLGEYNGKFMCNQMVLRGGSCATPAGHARISYRNFFYPPDRWQFTGVRLARDV
jgi:ergothioneine biosynthesis protein EgtB